MHKHKQSQQTQQRKKPKNQYRQIPNKNTRMYNKKSSKISPNKGLKDRQISRHVEKTNNNSKISQNTKKNHVTIRTHIYINPCNDKNLKENHAVFVTVNFFNFMKNFKIFNFLKIPKFSKEALYCCWQRQTHYHKSCWTK